ncbi:MAG: hypothetical protein NTY19_17780 [Planctomycetota bacterium]|nr:hypothetical protein [Planctomycetota bacterium]
MNKEILLNYMLWHVQMYADSVNEDLSQDPDSAASNLDELNPADEDLNAQILRLYNRRENACKYPPSSLPKSPKEMISVLRDYYKDDVTKISLVLHHYFPDQFVFYRVSRLDDEVFRGFEFFSDMIPDFDFDFERVRRNGFEGFIDARDYLNHLSRLTVAVVCGKWVPILGETRNLIWRNVGSATLLPQSVFEFLGAM